MKREQKSSKKTFIFWALKDKDTGEFCFPLYSTRKKARDWKCSDEKVVRLKVREI